MKTKIILTVFLITGFLFQINSQVPVVAPPQKKPVALKGGIIHTGTGEVIENGLITFSGGKITWVGKASGNSPDLSSFDVIDVTGKHVYPGLIFANTSLGLVEISGVDVTVDNRELGDLNPNVRAIAAYNTDSHVIPVIRSNGILLAQIVPTGTLLPGMASVVQLDAWNQEDAAYRTDNGIILGWPRRQAASQGRGGMPSQEQSGQTGQSAYDRSIEQLEKIFSDAVAYSSVEKPDNTNLRLEALKGLFNGTKILFINAPDSKSVLAAVTFARRFGVKRIVLTGANESTWEVKDFLKENNIPVIVSNPLSLPLYEHSDVRMPFKLAAMFFREGILTGITYSSQAYGNLPFAAGQTAAYGLTKEEALRTVTLNMAKILGIDDLTGSLETGKDANIVVSTGDILDMKTNNIEMAFITGRNISLDNKHKMLTRRFKAKYDNLNQGN